MMYSYPYYFLKKIESIWKILFGCVLLILLCTQEVLHAQTHFNFEFEGRQREYVVYLPQEFQPNLPVVFGFHGYRQGSNFISYSLLHEVADTAGFITVYPQSNPYWNTGLLYPGYPTIDTTVDDVGFISALIDTLYAHYSIDMRRIYSCGFSHGGGMTNILSGELSNRFAAVASVAGLFNDNSANRYNPVRPLPILHIHGTEDIIETWDGSKANLWSVDSTINLKLEKNGCLFTGDTVFLPDLDKTDGCTAEKISYTNCSGEGMLVFYKIVGGGHSWPGSAYTFGNEGNKNMDINANVEILNFFKKFENPPVDIPDTAFLSALIDEGVDTNGDGLISYDEAEVVSKLDISYAIDSVFLEKGWYFGPVGNIKLLTGIEAFANLETLICNGNNIQSLDLSKNTKLKYVDCRFNGYPHWSASTSKYYTWGRMESINVSICNDLEYLDCSENRIENLDVSNNPNLQVLDCSDHRLDDLDVSNNPRIKELYCSSNISELTELDVTSNPELRILHCEALRFESIDLTNNGKLEILHCAGNQHLSSLDVSNNPLLSELVTGYIIERDSRNTSWCGSEISSLDLSNNPELVKLNCTGSRLNELDVSGNPNLKEFDCTYSEIESLDFSHNPALIKLTCTGNPLENLNVAKCTRLTELIAGVKGSGYDMVGLENLDISNNASLEALSVYSPNLTSLKVSNNTLLKSLSLINAQIGRLDISNNRELNILELICTDTLNEVCVWEGFNPENIVIDTSGSPNVNFTTECTIGIIEEFPSGLSLYPNPTNNLLTIETEYPKHYSIEITSMNGQQLFNGSMEGTMHQIDLSSFRKGVYFITIRSKDFVSTRKIVKL